MPRREISVGPVLAPLALPPDPAVAPVWAAIERDLGLLAPPLILHSAVPGLLAAAWAVFRETVVVEAGLPRPVKEAIGVAVSEANRCPYCVDAHAVGLHAAGAGAVERALAAGSAGTRRLAPETRAWVEWASASARLGARPAPPPATPEGRAQGIGTAVAFHYINRMVTVLLPETLLPVRRAWLRRPVLALAGLRLAASARRRHAAGEALELLPPAPGPGPEWARAAPAAAAALAALGAAVDAAAAGALPAPARHRAAERIASWDGAEPPFGTAWLDEPAAGLAPPQAAAVRLALMTAFAPHRVGEAEIAALRRHPGDAALLGVLAWASYRTAEAIAGWLAPPAL